MTVMSSFIMGYMMVRHRHRHRHRNARNSYDAETRTSGAVPPDSLCLQPLRSRTAMLIRRASLQTTAS
jgi:hypothetical protein